MKCILCNSKKYKELFGKEDWKILKCQKCNLVFTQRDRYKNYNNSNNYHRDVDYQKNETLFRNIFEKRFRIIGKFVKNPDRVLEVGCSTGILLSLFKKNTGETWGVEPSKSGELAKNKVTKLLRTTFEKAELPKNYFDLVILNHTLEHLENPLLVLRKVNFLLKDGGIIFVDVPNFGGLSAKIFGRNWALLLPYEHNFQFTLATLRKLLIKSNFKLIYQESRSGLFEYANPFSEVWDALKTGKKRFFTDILGFPGALIATLLNKGSSLSVVGQKQIK